MLEDHTYTTWIAQSDTSTPPISTRGTGRRWRTMAVHGIQTPKKKPQKPKPKEQPMPKLNNKATMNVCLRLQIEQISSQSLHADTVEGNWLLVLAADNEARLGSLVSQTIPLQHFLPLAFAFNMAQANDANNVILIFLLICTSFYFPLTYVSTFSRIKYHNFEITVLRLQ